ncbi:uncharacterized protein LAJ45_02726 [Morchella importuna]|uniref:uncharacterized protein n=1 Tax=Morchella importuna TaxID=1174673 RepID=UPI001E8EC4F3|nr:uncharacterized protein LAJ45_02726 [Morchella importuna]KAH8153139.1 hypothetical protein LAJ45_02726 [Morchella importuna]
MKARYGPGLGLSEVTSTFSSFSRRWHHHSQATFLNAIRCKPEPDDTTGCVLSRLCYNFNPVGLRLPATLVFYLRALLEDLNISQPHPNKP